MLDPFFERRARKLHLKHLFFVALFRLSFHLLLLLLHSYLLLAF